MTGTHRKLCSACLHQTSTRCLVYKSRESQSKASPGIQTSHPGTSWWWAWCQVWPCGGKCSDRGASARWNTTGHRHLNKTSPNVLHLNTFNINEQCKITDNMFVSLWGQWAFRESDDLNSQVWWFLEAWFRIFQCFCEHQRTWRRPRWLQPEALWRRWLKKHPRTLETQQSVSQTQELNKKH